MADAITYPIIVVDEQGLNDFRVLFQAWADGKFQVKATAFDGDFESLTNIPTLDGVEIKGTLTKEGLGIAARDWVQALGYQTASQVNTLIKAAITGLFTYGGSKKLSELPTPTEEIEGYVYNITEGGTTDSKFVEGAGQPVTVGTNVVVAKTGEGEYKYDILGSFIDLTPYVTTTAMQQYVTQQLASYVTTDAMNTKLLDYLKKENITVITKATMTGWFQQ